MRVVLPAPFSPTRAWIRPGASSSETSWLATTGPNRRVTLRNATEGVASIATVEHDGRFGVECVRASPYQIATEPAKWVIL